VTEARLGCFLGCFFAIEAGFVADDCARLNGACSEYTQLGRFQRL